jgi:hypothetical protein
LQARDWLRIESISFIQGSSREMAVHLAEKPVFIVGQERSGTTLLMAMLGCHSRIAVPEVAW